MRVDTDRQESTTFDASRLIWGLTCGAGRQQSTAVDRVATSFQWSGHRRGDAPSLVRGHVARPALRDGQNRGHNEVVTRLWHACSAPEKEPDPYVLWHLSGCKVCAFKIQVQQRRFPDDATVAVIARLFDE